MKGIIPNGIFKMLAIIIINNITPVIKIHGCIVNYTVWFVQKLHAKELAPSLLPERKNGPIAIEGKISAS